MTKKNLDSLVETKFDRRDLIKLGGASLLLGLLGCGKAHHQTPIPIPQQPGTPQPGPQQQTNYHNYSGFVKDTDGNALAADVSLVQIDSFGNPTGIVFSDATNSSGSYSILNVTNGDYNVQISLSPGYFDFKQRIRLVSSLSDVTEDITMIRKEAISSTSAYKNILDIVKDISGNRTTDPVQKVRRFKDGKIKVFFNRSSAPTGYLASLEDALNDWEVQTGLSLFEETTIDRDSQLTMSYESSIGGKGLTQLVNLDFENGVSIPGKVKVRIKNNLTISAAKTIFEREVGHSLLGVERYSKDRAHVMFKDPNYLNTNDPLGSTSVTADEGKTVRLYRGLPIGLDLRNYS